MDSKVSGEDFSIGLFPVFIIDVQLDLRMANRPDNKLIEADSRTYSPKYWFLLVWVFMTLGTMDNRRMDGRTVMTSLDA